MGSFPTSVAQRLLTQLFITPSAIAHGSTEVALYNHTLTGTKGLSGTTSNSATVTLYVGLLWHFSNTAGGPATGGGFPGGNSFSSTGGITDAHIVSKGVWSNVTSAHTYLTAGVACSLTNTAGTPVQYNGRLAELTNGGFTGKGNIAGSTLGNGLLRKAINFSASTTFDDAAASASPSVVSNNPAGAGTAIAFGTYTAAATTANYDGLSMDAANCSIVGFFITPLAGSAIVGSWGSGTATPNGVGNPAAAVNANTPWIIAYGQLSSSRSINVGDQPQFTATAITITLA